MEVISFNIITVLNVEKSSAGLFCCFFVVFFFAFRIKVSTQSWIWNTLMYTVGLHAHDSAQKPKLVF